MKHVKLFETFDSSQEDQLRSEESPMTLRLDWSPSTDTAKFLSHLDEMCKKFNLSIIGLIPEGDAGRNPTITFKGMKDDLTKMALECGFYQEDDIDFGLKPYMS
jgi:hypothetical protein